MPSSSDGLLPARSSRPASSFNIRTYPGMNHRQFEALALKATKDVFAFANFAQQSENLFGGSPDAEALSRYQSAWFEVEIVNAVALADWEADGRPVSWDDKWRKLYQSSAADAVTVLESAAANLLPG